MRGAIAIFGDVHGNLIALETFVAATRGRVSGYVNLGDTVGYGPWPDACVARVRALCGTAKGMIEGNHERLHLGADDLARQTPLVQRFYAHAPSRCRDLTPITGLPLLFDLTRYRCQHAAPEPPARRRYLVGHSHRQGPDPRRPDIINVGSIGQCRSAINRVEWAEMDLASHDITLHSIPYPVDALMDALRAHHYPAECIDYYARKPRR